MGGKELPWGVLQVLWGGLCLCGGQDCDWAATGQECSCRNADSTVVCIQRIHTGMLLKVT